MSSSSNTDEEYYLGLEEEGRLTQNCQFENVISQFEEIDFHGSKKDIRSALEHAGVMSNFKVLPTEKRYLGIIQGLTQHEDESGIMFNKIRKIEAYEKEINKLPHNKRPSWNEQYEGICDIILGVNKSRLPHARSKSNKR